MDHSSNRGLSESGLVSQSGRYASSRRTAQEIRRHRETLQSGSSPGRRRTVSFALARKARPRSSQRRSRIRSPSACRRFERFLTADFATTPRSKARKRQTVPHPRCASRTTGLSLASTTDEAAMVTTSPKPGSNRSRRENMRRRRIARSERHAAGPAGDPVAMPERSRPRDRDRACPDTSGLVVPPTPCSMRRPL